MAHGTITETNDQKRFQYCPTLANLILTRRIVGQSGKVFDELGALSTTNNLVVLRNLCLELKPKRTLEIGLSFGGSALVFTSSHRDLWRSGKQQHVALDPYQNTVWDNCGLRLIEQAGLSAYLDFRENLSCFELPYLVSAGCRFEIVYIDGSHLFEDVFVDFYYVSRLLDESKVVLFDDCSYPHVRKVLRFVQTNFAESFAPFDLGPYRPDQGRSFSYRFGGIIGRRQLVAFQKVGPSERSWDSRFADF